MTAFTKTIRALTWLVTFLAIAGCGGGGGDGGGGGGGEPPYRLSFVSPQLNSASAAPAGLVDVTVTSDRAIIGAVNIAVIDSEGILDPSFPTSVTPLSALTYYVGARLSSTLPVGAHQGVLQVRLCRDDPRVCNSPLPGSPWRLPYNFTVGGVPSFAYYELCINPIFDRPLPVQGSGATNACSASGCHDNPSGREFRLAANLNPVSDYVDPAQGANTIRATNMFRNFYAARGQVIANNLSNSRLLIKPLTQGVLHGGGQIFANDQDANVRLIKYRLSHPAPTGQDEFSTGPSTSNMFTPPIDFSTFDPSGFDARSCNTTP